MTSQEVRQTRESLGMNRRQFADAVGASVRTIEAWETRITPGGFARAVIAALKTRKPKNSKAA